MRKEFYICVIALITLFGIFTVASANTFNVNVRLPTFPRHYYMGQETPFEFDLGVMLSDVNEVVFVCDGAIKAGLDYSGEPFSWYFKAYLDADTGYMWAKGPWAGEDTYPSPEPFTGQSQFRPLSGGTWDFLLDGYATGQVKFSGLVYIPEFPPRVLPSGYLNYASIRINADLLGDFDLNGEVDSIDFAIFALAWGSSPGDDNWNPNCNISDPNDNIIDELDLDTFTYNWLAGK